MQVYINGESKEFPTSISLQELIEQLELGPERVAVELNGLVVARSDWPVKVLAEGDRIEIVHFVGGGYADNLATDLHRSDR